MAGMLLLQQWLAVHTASWQHGVTGLAKPWLPNRG